jgi:RHS repeat-associated protein
MTHSLRSLSMFTLLAFFAPLTLAQAPPVTGTPSFGSFGGGPDIIDLANLNAHIDIPVRHKAGRGTDFTYDLSYDTFVWNPVPSGNTKMWLPAANWGWRAITEAALGYVSYTTTGPVSSCNGMGQTTTYSDWTYHDAFGVSHWFGAFGLTSSVTMGSASCNGTTGFNFTLGDGAGYTFNVNGLNFTLFSRDGTNINPPVNIGTGAGSFADRNGNVLSANTSGQFFDTLSSTTPVLTVAGSGTPASPRTFKYTAPSGAQPAFTAQYMPFTVQTNFGCSGIIDYPATSNINLITEIDLPDGSKYTFSYEATPGAPANVTGRLHTVTLPTGGTITYNYTGGSTGNITCADGSAPGLTRITPDGTWTYARTAGSGAAYTTTITDPERDSLAPNGNQTIVQFQGIYETQRQVYQGSSSSGTLLRTWNTCYNGSASPCTGTAVSLPITRRTVIDQYGSSGIFCKHNYLYNTFGLPTEQDDYDYPNATALLRTQLITYASLGNNIASMPHTITVCSPGGTASACNGSGTVVAQTTNTYDEGTVTAPSGTTPQHVAVSGSRGNPTTTSSLVQGTSSLTAHSSYFDTGMVKTSTDVNGAVTTFTYPDATSTCGNAFPTSVSEPLSLSRSMTWNCTGGMQASLTDENGKATTIGYLSAYFWRPGNIKDPTGAQTNFTYTQQASFESALSVNSGNSIVDTLLTFDSLGRPHINQDKQTPSSSNFDSIEQDYDSLGRPRRVTLAYTGTAGQTNSSAPATTTTYDALGRPLKVTDAGGGTTTYTYNQNDVLVVVGPAPSGENTKRRQLEYDSLGRLTSACEITGLAGNGACGQNASQTGYWTKYAYDVIGDVTSVTQNAQATSGQQTRAYGYDGVGRLTSETNPESGTTTYTYDLASSCATPNSFPGNLVKRFDNAGNATCYAYDALHRVLSQTYSGPNAPNTPNKYFVYDSATVNGVVMVNAKARLAEAYTAPSQTGAKIADTGFSYSSRGEISDQYQSSPNSGGYYHENLLYWENGVTKQISGLATVPTFTYGLDGEGRVNSISASAGQNPLTSTAYNAASLPTSVNLGSGDSDSFTYDPNTNRMTKYQFSVNGQLYVGTPTWNANGTLATLGITDPFNSADTQNCSYSHDDLVRIASVNCGASTWQQNFGYDAFGNLTKSVPPGGTGNSFQPTYSSTTNRITNLTGFVPSYDADGNVLNDSLNTFSWGSDGRPVAINGTSMTIDALGRIIDSGFQTATFYSPDGAFKVAFKGQLARRLHLNLPDGSNAIYDEGSGGLIEYDHADNLGSLRLASTPSRTFSYSMAYAPFGELYARSNPNAAGSFTGQGAGTSFDQYDFPFREYSDQGRWASPDPAGLAAVDPSNPQSWNRYAYVQDNPLSLVDPTGLFCNGANQTMWDTLANGTGIFDETGCRANGGSTVPWGPNLNGLLTDSSGGGNPQPTVPGGNSSGSQGPQKPQTPTPTGTPRDKNSCAARLANGVQNGTGVTPSNPQFTKTHGGHANYSFTVVDPTAFQSVLDQNQPWPLPFGLDTGHRYGLIASTHILDPATQGAPYTGHTDLFNGHSFLAPLHVIVDVVIGHIPGVNLDFGCHQ